MRYSFETGCVTNHDIKVAIIELQTLLQKTKSDEDKRAIKMVIRLLREITDEHYLGR